MYSLNGIGLQPRQAQVWWANAAPTPTEESHMRLLLQADELDRLGRFHFLADRHSYLCSHALRRVMLSAFLGGAPADWRFRKGVHGRPELESAIGIAAQVDCNISHTRGMVACAVVAGLPDGAPMRVGVDVENGSREVDWERLSGAVLSDSERQTLSALPAEARSKEFLRLWTIKEAAAKATGQGLAANFKDQSIVTVDGEPMLPGHQLASFAIHDFLLAVAIYPGREGGCGIQVQEAPHYWAIK